MNKVILMGRLTSDPEIRYIEGEEALMVARYTLAVNRRFLRNGEREADFIRCVAFGKQAEFAEKWMSKGVKFVVTGRIQTGSYTNKEGVKVYTTDVVVEDAEFAESKKNELVEEAEVSAEAVPPALAEEEAKIAETPAEEILEDGDEAEEVSQKEGKSAGKTRKKKTKAADE